MSRLAYIWVLAAVAAAFWFHAYEEAQRRDSINRAAAHALFVGVKAACESDNNTINQVLRLANDLHPAAARQISTALPTDDCRQVAHRLVRDYEEFAEH